jgi:tetratricopeptide (TPR) repeat protein
VSTRDTETYRGEADKTPDASAAAYVAPGDLLGHFEILERIGSGGMGDVYAARDTTLDRKVAVKVLRQEPFRGEERRARFLREAQALGKVIHANVVTVYEAGEQRGRLYIAMELIDGQTLRAWLETPRPWRDVLARLIPAGRGLAAAHRQGLVHRDFKPENVFVGKDGSVRVGDFGVVGLAGATPTPAATPASEPAAALTLEGSLVGTPQYMAPEQLQAGPVDARADQFAFAVSLYRALYRQPPFAGATLGELRDNVLAGNVRPPPPGANVPRRFERVVLRGLARQPEARHRSLDAMLAALERGPWVTPGRAVAAAAAIAVAAGGAWFVVRSARDPCPPADARLAGAWDPGVKAAAQTAFRASGRPYAADAFRRSAAALDAYTGAWLAMRTDACRATAERGEQSPALLDARMACLDRRLDGVRALTRLYGAADADIVDRAVSASLALDPLAGCSAAALVDAKKPIVRTGAARAIEERLDRAAAERRAGKAAIAAAELPAIIADARALGDKALLAEALVTSGWIAPDKDPKGAVAALEEAATLAGELADDDLEARALVRLMQVTGSVQGRRTDALALRPAVEAAARRTKDDRHLITAEQAISRLHYLGGNYDEGLVEIQDALARIDKTYGPDTIEKALALRDSTSLLDALGRNDEALAAGERALAIAEKVLGPDHADVSLFHHAVGLQEWRRRHFAAAKTHFGRMLAISEATVGKDSARGASALGNLAVIAQDEGAFDESLGYFQRALAMQEKVVGPDNAVVASLLNNMAGTLVALGRLDEALAANQRALTIREKVLPPTHPDLGASVQSIGEVLDEMGRAKEAIPWLERARAITEKGYPPGHAETLKALVSLARGYAHAGRPADALALCARVDAALAEHPQPVVAAHVAFVTAIALRTAGREPERAERLARQARAAFAADPPDKIMLARVDRFLSTH